jgi:hypothetical protein
MCVCVVSKWWIYLPPNLWGFNCISVETMTIHVWGVPNHVQLSSVKSPLSSLQSDCSVMKNASILDHQVGHTPFVCVFQWID